nr:HD domain-containing protein [Candidatus Woesearchaeota archaeon]
MKIIPHESNIIRKEDPIYGKTRIKEPVLIEILNSSEVLRLHYINQFGVPQKYQGNNVINFSRYDHSVGVFMLLRKLNASLEEQVAGLTHDVSHRVFSHISDWVLGSQKNEDSQDKTHKEFLYDSSLKKIIEQHGFNIERIANHHSFPLLEREIPELCADRIDYCLRELYYNQVLVDPKVLADSLISYQGKIIFNDILPASFFGFSFMNLQNTHWGNINKVIRYYLLADTVKAALRSHKLRSRDLWKTDQYIVEILENSKDPKIINKLRLLEQGFQFIEDQENPEIDIKNKFRYVNPAFLDKKQEVKYLMDVNENYKKLVEESKESNKRGIRGKIIPKNNETHYDNYDRTNKITA